MGLTVAIRALLFVVSTQTGLLETIPAAALLAAGIGLTLGLFTPICSAVIGVAYLLVILLPIGGDLLTRPDCAAAIVSLAAAIGLALLGPGAFSVDARLFGRRAIFIPGGGRQRRRT